MADFAVDLLKLTAANESVVMSPLSLVAALSVLQRGAGGSTKQQISDVLKRENDSEVAELIRRLASADGVLLNVATRLYLGISARIHDDYNNQVQKLFDVTTERLDFEQQSLTVRTVNDFVSGATNGMLKKFLSDDFHEPDMKALLVNAVYFKGQWATRFSPEITQKDVFHGINGDREESFMALSQLKDCRYTSGEGADVLVLPYKDHDYEFAIFLPFEFSVTFEEFRSGFNGEKMKLLLKHAEKNPGGVNVTIPKFKLSSSPNIKEMLVSLGITDLFDDSTCDLGGVSPDPLYVGDAIQKAIVEVNEEGTEAAAATAIKMRMRTLRNIYPVSEEGTEAAAATGMMMMVRMMPMEQDFLANRPFVYGIFRDEEPIFIGQYV
ncbi:hypothetical protein Q1695_001799 [Nippostrongylus brasiliensis]|nr:hypothetical protein Q1695_001799 [Nippostrongylus brasiliensis]